MQVSGTSEYNLFPFGVLQKAYKVKTCSIENLSNGKCMWPPCSKPVSNQSQYCCGSCISKHKHYRQVGITWRN